METLPAIHYENTIFLEAQEKALEERIKLIHSEILQFDYLIRINYQIELEEIARLKQELMDEIQPKKLDPQAGPEDHSFNQSNHTPSPESEKPLRLKADSSKSDLKSRCSKLYKKIAKRCHPDKTKDKDLHDIFYMAKKFYDSLDLDSLQKLEKLTKLPKWLMSKRTLEELKNRIAQLEMQLKLMISSREYYFVELYKIDKSKAINEAGANIKKTLDLLKMEMSFRKKTNPFKYGV